MINPCVLMLSHSLSGMCNCGLPDGSALEASEGGSGLGFLRGGGRLLLTGGVTQVEGAGGGGLSPWALIGG